MSPRRLVWLAALAFLIAHVIRLPPSLEDLDSVNFAMGVRDFDVALHQPHPPGYPVFTALGKIGSAAFRRVGVAAPEVRGLAVWSAVGGALLIPLAFLFFRAVGRNDRLATIGALLLATSPLLWFTALRPLSDVVGLASAFAALAALTPALAGAQESGTIERSRWLVAGAVAAGLSVGIRAQMAILVGPALVLVLLLPGAGVPARCRLGILAAAAVGIALWSVPLLVASGGPAAYLAALGSQAGEDFSGVEMLWTHRTPRVAVAALLNSFMLPWDAPILAGVVLALAVAGAMVVARRSVRALVVLAAIYVPYAVFHLLFQETVTVRYALPLVPPVVFLASAVLAAAGRVAGQTVTALLMALSLYHAVPAAAAYGRTPAPIFSLLSEMKLFEARGAAPIVAMHRRVTTESRRARAWAGPMPGTLLPSPRDHEWLELTRAWREGRDGESWFVADPRRTDLALIDAEYRRSRQYRWPFSGAVYVGGARPGEVDWHVYNQPGWFLEQGWALTPEIAGITERDGWGPHLRPSIGWIRRRSDEMLLMIGGRHLGGPADPPVRVIVAIADTPVATLEVRAGFFLHFEPLAAGLVAGQGYAPLTVRAEAAAPGPVPRVAIEQFNVQAAGVVQFGFGDGWHEPELDARTARHWRWMSEAASLRVHPSRRDVIVRIEGENPLRYYDESPRLWLTAGGRTMAEMRPDRDFAFEASIPASVLDAAGGTVVLHASSSFIAGEREGTADRRRLALRIYSVDIRPQTP